LHLWHCRERHQSSQPRAGGASQSPHQRERQGDDRQRAIFRYAPRANSRFLNDPPWLERGSEGGESDWWEDRWQLQEVNGAGHCEDKYTSTRPWDGAPGSLWFWLTAWQGGLGEGVSAPRASRRPRPTQLGLPRATTTHRPNKTRLVYSAQGRHMSLAWQDLGKVRRVLIRLNQLANFQTLNNQTSAVLQLSGRIFKPYKIKQLKITAKQTPCLTYYKTWKKPCSLLVLSWCWFRS
jgi:hypothetical protein